MASKKRALEDTHTDISESVPNAKKRKLNDDSDAPQLPTASPSLKPSAQPLNPNTLQTAKAMSPPTTNPSVNDININHDIDNDTNTNNKNKNDNTAKAKSKSNQNSKRNEQLQKKRAKLQKKNEWKFKASDFTFGDNSWVRQSSNISNISTTDTLSQTSKETIPNNNTTDSFSQFAGLGFQKALDDNKKTEQKEGENSETEQKKDSNPWSGAWSKDSNPDGTFKLNFNWGSWESPNAKIDLNPSTAVGWESTAEKYDPNDIEASPQTKKLVQSMGGKQDSGDADDDTKYSVECVVYNLEAGKYVERGKGSLKLNTYSMDSGLRGRILCRRQQILTTIINAPILKDMKFEKVGSFIRFGVVEMGEGDKEENDEDCDLNIKTYLIKPIDKFGIDNLLNKIKDIQEQVGK